MGLLDEFRQEQAGRGKVQCRIALIVAGMDKPDRADLEAALADTSIQHITITNVLRDHGHDIGKHSVSTHRNGRCGCPR
jgi:lipoate synthase